MQKNIGVVDNPPPKFREVVECVQNQALWSKALWKICLHGLKTSSKEKAPLSPCIPGTFCTINFYRCLLWHIWTVWLKVRSNFLSLLPTRNGGFTALWTNPIQRLPVVLKSQLTFLWQLPWLKSKGSSSFTSKGSRCFINTFQKRVIQLLRLFTLPYLNILGSLRVI